MLEKLNGKKTAIGFGLLLLATCLIGYYDGAGVDPPSQVSGVVNVLRIVGGAIGGIGVAHKATKREFTS